MLVTTCHDELDTLFLAAGAMAGDPLYVSRNTASFLERCGVPITMFLDHIVNISI